MKKNKKRMNDKGFSLVEVIVVIAIIGILTVTLTPRFTHYIEQARKASDQEVVNTIYRVAQIAEMSHPISAPTSTPDKTIKLIDAKGLYTISDGRWSLITSPDYETNYAGLLKEMAYALDSFKLKSKEVTDNTQIYIGKNKNGDLYVYIDYDTTTLNGSGKAYDYVVPEGITPVLVTTGS